MKLERTVENDATWKLRLTAASDAMWKIGRTAETNDVTSKLERTTENAYVTLKYIYCITAGVMLVMVMALIFPWLRNCAGRKIQHNLNL